MAAIIAVVVNTEGRREVFGLALGLSKAETFWRDFLRSLTRRGLSGVKLVADGAAPPPLPASLIGPARVSSHFTSPYWQRHQSVWPIAL